jgi:predicted RNA methylase
MAGSRLKDRVGPLYDAVTPSTRSGALFNAFSYPTKISPEVIALYIATHTRPGDTVLDVFAGSGTTGIAAKLCDRPTPEMMSLAEKMGITPHWGPRNAVLYEISVVGSLLAESMANPPDPDAFRKAADKLVTSAERELDWMYQAVDPEGNVGRIRHIIWSDVLTCVACGHEVTYWEASVRTEPLGLASEFACPSCRATMLVIDCPRATETVMDGATGERIEAKKRVPARVYGSTGKRTWQREPNKEDLDTIQRVDAFDINTWYPSSEIFWGDLYRKGYHQGITRYHHFYTKRNLIALSQLWHRITQFPSELQDSLKLAVLSFNATHSTLMTRVVVKKGQKDFILTGAQSGVLYISGLPVEKNIFEGVRRKTKTFVDAFKLTTESRSHVTVVNASSTKLDLPSQSVAYTFTDPPFGAYIPYAELNQINEAWLGCMTERTEEAIISPAQGKAIHDYRTLLTDVFSEVARVLRPDGLATVVFHSSKADVWKAVGDSFEAAGFAVAKTSVLDKTQPSFKQSVSAVSSKGDVVFLLTLGETKSGPGIDIREVVKRARATGSPVELLPDRLYSRYVALCIEARQEVAMGAFEFYTTISHYID